MRTILIQNMNHPILSSAFTLIAVINHGYWAIDFFFILSDFVIGYAYDDRWKKNLILKGFSNVRLIRV